MINFSPSFLLCFEPLSFCLPLAYQTLFCTTKLRSSVENYPSKNMLDFGVNIPKIYMKFTYSSVSVKHVSRCTKTFTGLFNQLGVW